MYNVITFIPLFLHARVMTKNLFNPQFGSIFRTCHNPTYFSRRLCRFSDLYMTSLSCLLNYDLSYTFYPRRTPLQHEAPLWMDQLCTGCMKTPFLEEMSHIRWEPESHKWLIRFYVFFKAWQTLDSLRMSYLAGVPFNLRRGCTAHSEGHRSFVQNSEHFPRKSPGGCRVCSSCPESI